jgi:hypothetical protein
MYLHTPWRSTIVSSKTIQLVKNATHVANFVKSGRSPKAIVFITNHL